MTRIFLKSVLMTASFSILYHLGTLSPLPKWLNLDQAFSETLENSEKEGEVSSPEKILVEVFLAKQYKKEKKVLKEDWGKLGIKRVRLQFFKLGDPPANMAIGSNIPAETARFAIDWALQKNKGVAYILPQFRFFNHHIVIGSSHYDEDSQIPITPEDLESLRNPELTHAQFHELYRKLTGEDKGNPTYLDSERFKEK